jgi:hypothetical protein
VGDNERRNMGQKEAEERVKKRKLQQEIPWREGDPNKHQNNINMVARHTRCSNGRQARWEALRGGTWAEKKAKR